MFILYFLIHYEIKLKKKSFLYVFEYFEFVFAFEWETAEYYLIENIFFDI